MDPSCQRYTGRQGSQEGSGSQCSANEPEVRLFHGRCVWFLCGRVHVFFWLETGVSIVDVGALALSVKIPLFFNYCWDAPK